MKISLFIANIVAVILVINFLVAEPSITGFVVAPKFGLDLTSPFYLAVLFIIITIALDVYFYLKTKQAE